MANSVVRKCCIHRSSVVLKTKRNLISVERGMGYHTPNATIPNQTPSSSISLPHFNPQSTEIVSWRNILPPSSDSLLKMQAAYFSKTLLPRPHYVSSTVWKPEVKYSEI